MATATSFQLIVRTKTGKEYSGKVNSSKPVTTQEFIDSVENTLREFIWLRLESTSIRCGQVESFQCKIIV